MYTEKFFVDIINMTYSCRVVLDMICMEMCIRDRFYISCCMEAYDRMLQEICRETGTASVYGDIPECVECVEKSNCLILMNHSGEKQQVLLKGYRDIRNEKSRIIIEEYGFAVAVSS